MAQNLKATSLKAIFLILFFASKAFADIPEPDYCGIHDLIAPEYQHISPIYGLLLGPNTLKNIRAYGNYGPKNKDHPCMEDFGGAFTGITDAAGVHQPGLNERNDCPQDHTTELIQRLFPTTGGVNFGVTQFPKDIVSHLKPETLGKVSGILAQVKDTDLADLNQTEILENQIQEILFRDINPEGYKNQLNNKKSELEKEKKRCKKDSSKLQEVASQIVALTPLIESLASAPKGEGKEKDFKALSKLIIASLKESRIEPTKYPKHFPEQALLYYLSKKGNSKADLLDYLKGLSDLTGSTKPAIPNGDIFKEGDQRNHFLTQRCQIAKLEGTPEVIAQEVLKNPEKLLILEAQKEENAPKAILPPRVGFSRAKHSALAGSGDGKYNDCGETSLRSFFNIVLYDPSSEKFNPSFFEEFKKNDPNIQIATGLSSFYQKHTDPKLAMGEDRDRSLYPRDDWSETVVSKHEGVNYLKPSSAPKCEINAGIDNMMNVIDRLLYSNATGNKGALSQAKDRSSKFDLLCKLFSKEGKKLSWKFKGHQGENDINKTNLGLVEFSINGSPSFTWLFNPLHFEVNPIEQAQAKAVSLKDKVIGELAKIIGQDGNQRSSTLLNRLVNKGNIPTLIQSLKKKDSTNLVYSLPIASLFSDTDNKKIGFKAIVSHPHAKRMKRLGLQFQNALPTDDMDTQQFVHSTLADHDYPLGNAPTHAIGKPDAIYTRVSEEDMTKHFGADIAKKMGRSWRRKMFGQDVVIGEPLTDSNGTELMFNNRLDLNTQISPAEKACLDLNSADKRSDIGAAFKKRRDKIDEFNLKMKAKVEFAKPDKLSATEQNELDEILRDNPISGCYLPSRPEWKVIEADFGKHENKYIPQFLPKLYNREFWSSSVSPFNSDSAFYFSSYGGNVGYGSRVIDDSVRCSCSGAAAWLR